ncbi:Hsp70 family protein, partial [Mycobacterium sp.]|uniref:Hsp70 family protein n=1 Tax=Mycobacterium sp. TaxID=1785 RepID=UPI003BB10D1E
MTITAGGVLAIDFGTTATAAAVSKNGGESRSVMLADGSATLSSSVFAQGEQFVVGSAADNLANWALDAYEPTPKRRVGEPRVLLGGYEFAPSELIAAVLASILEEAVGQHGEDTLGSVTLTHPVSWGPTRRQVLAEAFSAAASQLGLTRLGVPNFVPEPVAAAHWYARQQPLRTGDYIGVYDLGGGTFDTAVLRKTGEDAYEVVKSGGLDPLGGVDFDYLLSDYLGQRHIADANPQLWEALSPQAGPPTDSGLIGQRRKLQETVKTIKEQLTRQTSMNVYLPGVPGMVLVTRAQYEELIADHIEKTVAELEDTIAEAGLTPDDLTAIYRIGGAARTPLVGDKLARLQRPVRVIDQPKLVVAQGAALAPATAITHDEPPPQPPPGLTGKPISQPPPGLTGEPIPLSAAEATRNPTDSADLPGPSRFTAWVRFVLFVGAGIVIAGITGSPYGQGLLLGCVAGLAYLAYNSRRRRAMVSKPQEGGSTDLPEPSRVKDFLTTWIPFVVFVGAGIVMQQVTRHTVCHTYFCASPPTDPSYWAL